MISSGLTLTEKSVQMFDSDDVNEWLQYDKP